MKNLFAKTLSLIAFALLAACASSGGNQARVGAAMTDAPVLAGGADTPTNKEDEVFCVAEKVTGTRNTRNTRQVCHTRAEWASMKRAGQEATRTIQGMPTGIVEEGG